MTQEEKAKRYDEAFERAKSFFRRWENVEEANSYLVLEEVKDIFPELKESEDERIRKTLIEMFSNAGRNDWKGITNEKVIAWLEKQGSKPQGKTALEAIKEEKVDNKNCIKTDDKVEHKFEVGAWITFYEGKPFKIIKIEAEINGVLDYLLLNQNDHDSYYNKRYVDENARLWTILDANNGDVLVDVYGNIGIYEKRDYFDWTSYCSLGFHGGFQNFKVEHENDKTHPATKEQRELLFQKMHESGYEWDAEKKVLIPM